MVGGAFDDGDHGAAAVGGGGDIEENHFVGALLIVAEGEFDGVADVAETAFFGDAELDAAGDLAVVDVQAGNDTFCDHGDIEARLSGKGQRFKRVASLKRCIVASEGKRWAESKVQSLKSKVGGSWRR